MRIKDKKGLLKALEEVGAYKDSEASSILSEIDELGIEEEVKVKLLSEFLLEKEFGEKRIINKKRFEEEGINSYQKFLSQADLNKWSFRDFRLPEDFDFGKNFALAFLPEDFPDQPHMLVEYRMMSILERKKIVNRYSQLRISPASVVSTFWFGLQALFESSVLLKQRGKHLDPQSGAIYRVEGFKMALRLAIIRMPQIERIIAECRRNKESKLCQDLIAEEIAKNFLVSETKEEQNARAFFSLGFVLIGILSEKEATNFMLNFIR